MISEFDPKFEAWLSLSKINFQHLLWQMEQHVLHKVCYFSKLWKSSRDIQLSLFWWIFVVCWSNSLISPNVICHVHYIRYPLIHSEFMKFISPVRHDQQKKRTDTRLVHVFCNGKLMRTDILFTGTTKSYVILWTLYIFICKNIFF
jgi:hypothetical protein